MGNDSKSSNDSGPHLALGLFVIGLLVLTVICIGVGLHLGVNNRREGTPIGAGLCFLAAAISMVGGFHTLVKLVTSR